MARYTFVVIENEDVMEVPGKIEHVITSRPHSKDQFAALVRLPERESGINENDESEDNSDDYKRVDLSIIDGVGNSTAKEILNEGYGSIEAIRNATTDELEEINGVGPATAENIKNYVE